MYYETKDQNIYNLPLELIFKIVMDYDLSLSDIIHLCQSSIYLYYQLYQNNLFWRSLYLQNISSVPLEINFNNIVEKENNYLSATLIKYIKRFILN